MNKVVYTIIILALVVGIGIVFVRGSNNSTIATSTQSRNNVEIKEGVQFVTVNAKGGYSPKMSIVGGTPTSTAGISPSIVGSIAARLSATGIPRTIAKAGIPTKLIIKTDGTYDCSASLVVRSIGYQKVLSQTGEEVIDLGVPKAQPLQGVCGMGMYNFQVQFS